jgi:excinuclease ABC subunit C
MTLEEKLQNLPDEPGVYLMKDARKQIIYVGKAVSLRNRVRSYFQKGAKDEKTEALVRSIADLETIVTHTELEALILESTLIKKHHPRFNVILRDDKNYPYLRLDLKSDYPRLDVVRGLKKDGAVYYGPYVPAGGMWELLSLIRRTFPLATCKKELRSDRPERPCVQHQIGRCMAPCSAEVSKEAYRDMIQQMRLFIEGKNRDLVDLLKKRMAEASERMEYERAAELRDRIAKIEGAFEKQKIISPNFEDQDVIGIAFQDGNADIQALFIRNGMLLGRKDFYLSDVRGMQPVDVLLDFLHQFYAKEMLVPAGVLLPFDVPDRQVFEEWLTGRRGSRVEVLVPQRGRKRELVQMATDNASQSLREQLLSQRSRDRILANLQEELALVNLPRRIEAFDISTIQGADSVGSMVTFDHNRPDKGGYKRFRIKDVAGQDDFGMMQEVIRRRYSNPDFGAPPDLIVIDGGKGQLNAALEVLAELGIAGPDIVGLAKARSGEEGTDREFERVFLPGERDPIILPPASSGTHLIARVRDEAHRFAIEYHRKLREKRAIASELDEIPGIGEARKKALLRHFGSVAKVRDAGVDELANVKGMTRKAAEGIAAFYRTRTVTAFKEPS